MATAPTTNGPYAQYPPAHQYPVPPEQQREPRATVGEVLAPPGSKRRALLGAVGAVAGAMRSAVTGEAVDHQTPATPPPPADPARGMVHPYPLRQAVHPTPAPATPPPQPEAQRPSLFAVLLGRFVGGAPTANTPPGAAAPRSRAIASALGQLSSDVEREATFQRWFRVIAVTFGLLLAQAGLAGALSLVAVVVGTSTGSADNALVAFYGPSGPSTAVFVGGRVALCSVSGCVPAAGARACGAGQATLGLLVPHIVLKAATGVCAIAVIGFLCRRTPTLIGDPNSRVVEHLIYFGWLPSAVAAFLSLAALIVSQGVQSAQRDPCGAVALLAAATSPSADVTAVAGAAANLIRTVFVVEIVGGIVLLFSLLFLCLLNENHRRQRTVCCCFC